MKGDFYIIGIDSESNGLKVFRDVSNYDFSKGEGNTPVCKIATDNIKVEEGGLYLVPSTKSVVMESGRLRLIDESPNQMRSTFDRIANVGRDLEEFAYITAHHLKAPVINMMSLFNLIDHQKLKDDDKIVFDHLKNSLIKMNDTIGSLNEVISIKKDVYLECERLDFSKELNKVIESTASVTNEWRGAIRANFSEVESVNFPSVHLRTIFDHLITNSIKFRSSDKQLNIHIKSKLINDRIVLEVQDNCRGIDLEKYGDKLFGLYERFHVDVEGIGIGLYTIKSLVESYGGKIEVESVVSKGTTVRMYFKK